MTTTPSPLRTLVARYDPDAFDLPAGRWTLALEVDGRSWTVELAGRAARLEAIAVPRPAATLTADAETWRAVATEVAGGLTAFQSRRLRIRGNLHIAVGFLAATAQTEDAGRRLRVLCVRSRVGALSTLQAGAGEPLLMLHGLGGTKASFLPTIAALAPTHRSVAVDLPGFGDSTKPVGAPYGPRFFARTTLDLADALGFDRFHLLGHSMGGRAALETALRAPERVASVSLFTPSMAWLRGRQWAPLLRLVPPELGLLQLAPRAIVDPVVHRLVSGGAQLDGWLALGVDEFLRAYHDPRGRAAFYASARSIYLEEPAGSAGLWTRLEALAPPALFVWGRRDRLVPVAFQRHVRRVLPGARHVVLDCGHIPQFEAPQPAHTALSRFLAAHAARGLSRAM